MPAQHGSSSTRLSALETSFLLGEEVIPGYTGHIASVFVFEGPPPSREALVRHVEARLGPIPRYYRRVVAVPGAIARPAWVPDADFDVRRHVQTARLPAPGGEAQLWECVAQILTRTIDRQHPLWELWLVEGLNDGRWALLNKVQHAIADGAELAAILRALLNPEFGGDASESESASAVPGPGTLLRAAAGEGVQSIRRGARRVGSALMGPRAALARSLDAVRGLREMSDASKRPVLDSPLTGQSGPRRAIEWIALERDAMKQVATERDMTVNDVYLAIVTGGLRRWLVGHELLGDDAPLMAMVPVAVRDRRGDDATELGMLNVALPVYEADTERRMQATAATMRAAKDSRQGAAIAAVLGLQNLLPVALLRAVGRQLWTARGLNVTITSMPGSIGPVSVAGCRAIGGWQIGFLTPGLTLTFASMNYVGRVTISLIADPAAITDLDALARGCAEEAAAMGLTADSSISRTSAV